MSPITKLDKIQFVDGLPKTRSKMQIMRRILRKIAEDFSNFEWYLYITESRDIEHIKEGSK
jgi:acetyl-CoA synthetase